MESPIYWEVIVPVILSKKICVYIYPIPNCYRGRAILFYSFEILGKNDIVRSVSNNGINVQVTKVVQFT